jgi:hydrogenase maturation protease
MKPLILGLGNELLGDDGVGIYAACRLAEEISPVEADIQICRSHGVTLLDFLAGYEKVIIIDAIESQNNQTGTVIELTPDDFRPISNPSPHYTGLPELITLARELDLEFPKGIKILGVAIKNGYVIGDELSVPIKDSLEKIVTRVKAYLRQWKEEAVALERADPLNR